MQPFLGSISYLQVRRQSFDIFDDLFVDIRHAKLEAVCHGEFVGVAEEFVGKCGS